MLTKITRTGLWGMMVGLIAMSAVVFYVVGVINGAGVPFGSPHHPERDVNTLLQRAQAVTFATGRSDQAVVAMHSTTPEFSELKSYSRLHSDVDSRSRLPWLVTVHEIDEPHVFYHELRYYPDTGEIGEGHQWYFTTKRFVSMVTDAKSAKVRAQQ